MNDNRAIFFDRDGVLIEPRVIDGKPYPPESWLKTRIYEDVSMVLEQFKAEGFYLIVISNQPDVARGTQTREAVENINSGLLSQLPLDDILVCYHDDSDQCDCRKPKTGMIVEAAQRYSLDLHSSFVVGDRAKDIQCGKNAGCMTVFINHDYAEEKPFPAADLTVSSLSEAVEWILGR